MINFPFLCFSLFFKYGIRSGRTIQLICTSLTFRSIDIRLCKSQWRHTSIIVESILLDKGIRIRFSSYCVVMEFHLMVLYWQVADIFKVASIIFLDSPVGSGFSYAQSSEGYRTSDSLAAAHGYDFLKKVSKNASQLWKNALLFL